jgi:peroxiredoxin
MKNARKRTVLGVVWLAAFVAGVIVGGPLPAASAAEPMATVRLGQIKHFDLHDVQGKPHAVGEWQGAKAVLLLFLGTECPVSNGYAPDFERLAKSFSAQGVRVYGVHSDPDVTDAIARTHAAEYGLGFTMLLDPQQKLAAEAGVKVVPQAVVLNAGGQILYRGRVDNRYTLEGKRRVQATSHELEAALNDVLAGKAPAVEETKPFGCPLPRLRKTSP